MKKIIFPLIALLLYTYILIKVLVLKDIPALHFGNVTLDFGGTHDGPANWIPFKTIIPYLLGSGGWLIGGMNILGNIVLLVPIGFLLPFVFPTINWKQKLAFAIIACLLIETTQAILHIGIFDIDDVILNALGVMIGFWKFSIWPKFAALVKRNKLLSIITVLIIIGGIHFAIDRFIKSMPPLRKPIQSQVCCDLCGGTGGTGAILSANKNSFTLKRRDGAIQEIKLTDKTIIKNAEGIISKIDLKAGDRVTVIIDETETASLVLVCLAPKH